MSTLTVQQGTGSFFAIGLALLDALIEHASLYTSAQRTEIYRAGVCFCYIPMLQAEVEDMNGAGSYDLQRARSARRDGEMYGEGNQEREQQLTQMLLRLSESGVFSGRVFDSSVSLYSNVHFIVSEAQVALRDAAELIAGISPDVAARKALISRALAFTARDHTQPYGLQYGLMMLTLASIADLLYGSSPELDELFTADKTLVALGPIYLSPVEMRAKAMGLAEAVLSRTAV